SGGCASLPPLQSEYSDYVRWQSQWLASAQGERLWGYWRKQLSGELPILNLPTDRRRPSVQTYQGASQPFSLKASLTARLKQISREHSATLYVTLLAAF